MRPRSALALTAATAALLLPVPAAAAPQHPLPGRTAAADGLAPRCGGSGTARFPVETAVRGGAAAFLAGGERQRLELVLRNATDRECRGVHPVVVLTHEDGARLAPEDVRLRFHDEDAGRWRPVSFEGTGEGESVGVFASGFRGFTLPARAARTVPVRMGFAAGAPAGRVVVNVTTVQRRADDGEWVGQSKDYVFTVAPGTSCCGTGADPSQRPAPPRERAPEAPEQPSEPVPERPAEPGASPRPGGSAAPGTPAEPGAPPQPPAPAGPGAPAQPRESPVPRWPDDGPQAAPRLPDAAPMPEGLADTGPRPAPLAAAATGALLAGAALLAVARRLRRRTPAPGRPAVPASRLVTPSPEAPVGESRWRSASRSSPG